MATYKDSKIIYEDIKNLSESLKDYIPKLVGKTILITGSGGLLGTYMVYLLEYINEQLPDNPINAVLLDNYVTGYEKSVSNTANIKFIKHNVINPFNYDNNIDYIIHAAGIASPVYYTKYPIETLDVGIYGTRNMLELAKEKNVEGFLFTSSSEVYGDPDPNFVPTPETYRGNVSILGPRAVYDESKRVGETMTEVFHNVYGVKTKVVRPFNVYGPGIRPDDYRVLPNFIEHALRNEPLPVHGNGLNTRAYCYINDAIESIYKILISEKTTGQSYNIGNPDQEISVIDLAKLVKKTAPHEVEIINTNPPLAVYADSDPKRRCPDISKLQQHIDFNPKYNLKQGLERTIEWYLNKSN